MTAPITQRTGQGSALRTAMRWELMVRRRRNSLNFKTVFLYKGTALCTDPLPEQSRMKKAAGHKAWRLFGYFCSQAAEVRGSELTLAELLATAS
jgi:hypothetical protein